MWTQVVDVRDVADLHLRAMTAPGAAGQRHLALADGLMSFHEIAAGVGYRNEYAFATAFRRQHGLAPGRWRTAQKAATT